MYFLTAGDGEVIWQCSCGKSIEGIIDLKNGGLFLGLEDGSVYAAIPQDQLLYSEGTNVQRSTDGCLYDTATRTFLLLSRESGEMALLKWIPDEGGEFVEKSEGAYSWGISASGRYYLVYYPTESGYPDGVLIFYNRETGEEMSSVSTRYFKTGYWFENMPGADGSDAEVFYYVESVYDDDTYGANSRLVAYDPEAGEVVWEIYSKGYLSHTIAYDNEQPLFLQWEDGDILLLDMASGETEDLYYSEEDTADFAEVRLSGSGRYLLGRLRDSAGDKPELVLYDRAEKEWTDLTEVMEEQGAVISDTIMYTTLFVSEEGDIAAICDRDQNQICVIDLPSGEIAQKIPCHTGSSQEWMVFLEGNTRLLFWGDDGYLKLWDLEQECLLMEDSRKLCNVSGIEVSEDGRTLLVTGVEEDWTYYYDIVGTGFVCQIYRLGEDGRFYFYTDVIYGTYLHYTNQLSVYDSIEECYYLYDFYTLDELIAKAEAVLDDYELSEAEKYAYFIGE